MRSAGVRSGRRKSATQRALRAEHRVHGGIPGNAGRAPHPLPPVFSQVLIIKGVKVICFDTLLQVLILKVVTEMAFASRAPRPGFPVDSFKVPPTPVFCQKSLDLLDYKGVDFFERGKEAASL